MEKQLSEAFLEQASRVRPIPEKGNARKKKAGAVHIDATKAGDVGRSGLCGFAAVQTENDVSRVTCKVCLKRWRAQSQAPANNNDQPKRRGDRAERKLFTAHTFAMTVIAAFRAMFAMKAPFPPRVSSDDRVEPAAWLQTCKGRHRPCSASSRCPLCEWEQEVKKADHVAPWNERRPARKAENAPRWSSVDAALVTAANWLQHGRWSPSAMGGILARIESAEVGGQSSLKGEDPLMRRAGDIAPVFQALNVAYPPGGSSKLTPAQSMDVLLNRTPGTCPSGARKDEAEPDMATYEALAERFGVATGDLKACVKHGRRVVYEQLLERGLVARAVPRKRDRAASSVHVAEGFEEGLVANG